MDEEIRAWISTSIEEIHKELEELKWQKYLPLLPGKLFTGEGDPRSGILLTLSWLLTDLFDCNWEGFTVKEVVQILRDIADVIENCSGPF